MRIFSEKGRGIMKKMLVAAALGLSLCAMTACGEMQIDTVGGGQQQQSVCGTISVSFCHKLYSESLRAKSASSSSL